jgi:hypothetical protein
MLRPNGASPRRENAMAAFGKVVPIEIASALEAAELGIEILFANSRRRSMLREEKIVPHLWTTDRRRRRR